MDKPFDISLFLATLDAGYRQSDPQIASDPEQAAKFKKRISSLKLAIAQGKKLQANATDREHALQLVVLGPTQAGKSTLVNAISQSRLAGVSALAGYTVHAQGILLNSDNEDTDTSNAAAKVFDPYKRVNTDELQHDELKQYTLSVAPELETPFRNKIAVWDSPDFDSISAKNYSEAVLKVAALADVIIYVVSKDKYADRSVWNMVDLLRALNKPSIFVVNKLDESARTTVLDALDHRLSESFGSSCPPVIDIPYAGRDAAPENVVPDAALQSLWDAVEKSSIYETRQNQRDGLQQLFDENWDSWVTPVRQENQAQLAWEQTVAELTDNAIDEYQSNYLNHPQKYDTFNRAIAELLTLLELPGLAKPLGSVRKLVTWPARQVLSMAGVGGQQAGAGQSNPAHAEQQVLLNNSSLFVSRAQNTAIEKSTSDETILWQAISQQLQQQHSGIQQSFANEVDTYQTQFEPEIEAAARSLYRQLQKQPKVLAGLRAARVTTDAAAIVLAVKSGGLAASDLLIAPAVLSVTTLLTESAIGKYMDTVKSQLKEKQLEQVKVLYKNHLEIPVKQVPQNLDNKNLFAIEKEWLGQAEKARSAVALQFEQANV